MKTENKARPRILSYPGPQLRLRFKSNAQLERLRKAARAADLSLNALLLRMIDSLDLWFKRDGA